MIFTTLTISCLFKKITQQKLLMSI